MRARPHGSCADRLSRRGRRDQSSRSGLQAVLERPTLHRTLRPTKTRSGSLTAARFPCPTRLEFRCTLSFVQQQRSESSKEANSDSASVTYQRELLPPAHEKATRVRHLKRGRNVHSGASRARTGDPLLAKQLQKHTNHGKKPSNGSEFCCAARPDTSAAYPLGLPRLQQFLVRKPLLRPSACAPASYFGGI